MKDIQIKFKFKDTDYMTMDELNNKKEIIKMNNGNLALKLVEGTKEDRDQYINRVDVLDKVKELVMLPNEKYITTNDIANYYGVNVTTIRNMKNRHNEEFTSDGVITIKGLELKKYKERIQSTHHVLIKGNAYITLYTRRSVLRMGMLLTESPVALKIQDYLLNVEESATQGQKQNALKFVGEWTPELDQYVFDKVNDGVKNGQSVKHLLSEVAKEIDSPEMKVHTRWYAGNKQLRPLRDRLDKNTKELVAKGDHLRLVNTENKENKLIYDEMHGIIKKQQEMLSQVISEVHNVKESNDKLYKGMAAIWRGYKAVNESNKEISEDITKIKQDLKKFKDIVNNNFQEKVNVLEKRVNVQAKKIKEKRNEVNQVKVKLANLILGDTDHAVKNHNFKADKNGNLTEIN